MPDTRRAIAGELLEQLLGMFHIPAASWLSAPILDVLSRGDPQPAPPSVGEDHHGPFQFGVTEFSISLSPDRQPDIRCLAEVVSQRPPLEADLRDAQGIGRSLLGMLTPGHEGASTLETFDDIFHAVYDGPLAPPSRAKFRFGLAVEWSCESPPSGKCYFDLYSGGRARAYDRLEAVLRLLGFSAQLPLLAQLASEVQDKEFCRGIGVDFSSQRSSSIRLYLAGKHFSLDTIQRLLLRVGGPDQLPALALFDRLVLNRMPPRQPLSAALVGLVFSPLLPPGRAIIKLDAYLPDHKVDDKAANASIVDLCTSLGVAPDAYQEMLKLIAGSRRLGESRCLQQYLSIDLLAPGRHRVNVYFRPFGLETSHLSPRHRPRRKEPELRRVDDTIRRAIAFLERERSSGFAEATHRVVFPHSAGFGGTTEEQQGCVFQRAMICESLLQAATAGFEVDWTGIDEDVVWLVAARCQDVRGGWRYFPDLPDLPPDADDLAAVLRVVTHSGSASPRELCDDAIDLLFGQNSAPDGSFGTWIVDRHDPGAPTRLMIDAIEAKWGDRADVEVIANLLHSLHLYDAERFEACIRKGVEYIAARQDPEGFWLSTWYCGKFYGTYVCTQAISATQPSHYLLPRVARWLEGTQREDRGWGDPVSNPTDTALALLSLALLSRSVTIDPAVVRGGLDHLLGCEVLGGQWNGSPLIQMDTNRVMTLAGAGRPRIIRYQSATVASAICLQALCAVRSWIVPRS